LWRSWQASEPAPLSWHCWQVGRNMLLAMLVCGCTVVVLLYCGAC
jgi:hypothetical protein